ncbi:hypothetical protein Tco_0968558 [Tanacetum coccineum]
MFTAFSHWKFKDCDNEVEDNKKNKDLQKKSRKKKTTRAATRSYQKTRKKVASKNVVEQNVEIEKSIKCALRCIKQTVEMEKSISDTESNDIIQRKESKKKVTKKAHVKKIDKKASRQEKKQNSTESESESDSDFEVGTFDKYNRVERNKDGIINERLIPYLDETDKIHQMDWCSYVLESLVKECSGSSDRFSGPVLLLVTSTYSPKVYNSFNKELNKKKKLKSITEDEDETPEKVEQKEDFHYKTFEDKVYDDETDGHNDDKDDDDGKDKNNDKNDDKIDKDNHDETNGENDDLDEDDDDDDENDDNDENDENIRNEKEKKKIDEGNKEEVGSENVKDDKVEQKDENVEEEKEKKKVPDYKVWDKTKAIVPFVNYHDYEINDTQSSTEDAEYNDNVSGEAHVIDEVNVLGASNAVDSQETLNCFLRNELEDFEPLTLSQENGKKYSNNRRKLPVFDDVSILNTRLESKKISDPSLFVHQMIEDMTKLPLISGALKEADTIDGKVYAKKIDDVPCSEDKGTVNAVEVPHQKVINVAKDKTVQVTKKEVPKKINAKFAVKRIAKVVDVPPDKVVDAAKKKLAAMTQINNQDLQLKSLKMIIKRLKEEEREKTMSTKPFIVAEKKIIEYIWSYNSPEGDIVFTGKGLQIECIWFFSLYPKIQLSSNIIDLWSTILNDEEKYKGKQSVTRNIYCSTGMVDLNCDALGVNRHEPPHMVENKKEVMRKRRTVFNENIEYILKEAKKKIFNDVHLVFFTCIKLSEEEETSNHYYLICFNMMTAEIDIIDNIHNDLEDLDLRYGPYAMAL